MANETPDSKPRLRFISDLAKKARSLDDTRLITAALDTQSSDQHGRVIDDPLSAVVDVIGINSYCGWYGGALQGYHGDVDQRWTEEYRAAVYRHNLTMMDNISFFAVSRRGFLRTFVRRAAPCRISRTIGTGKGLISDSGIKKQAWHVLRDYYRKIPE